MSTTDARPRESRASQHVDDAPADAFPVSPAAGPATPAAGAVAHRPWWTWRLDFAGLAAAIAFLCLSMTPSLLPRTALLQGIISGILAVTGYLVGAFAGWVGRRLVGWRPRPGARRVAWVVLWGAAVPSVTLSVRQGSRWQRDIHRLMELPPPPRSDYLEVLLLAGGIFVGLVVLARSLRAGARMLGRYLGRWVPAPLAKVTAALAVAVLAVGLLQGVVANRLMSGADASFRTLNGETTDGVAPPGEAVRSGSAESYVPWSSLGKQGRNFVARGPRTADLERFSGQPAVPPIRVYVGLDSAPTLHDRAVLAVRELERTGAFDRKVLCVVTTTGTGWVDRRSVDPLEYMYNGDSALVALQYSYLPSWLSFVVDRDRVRGAGRELFNEVYAVWSALPVGHRPKLLVFGESLGAFGAESAFSGVDDVVDRTDGMLLIGPPNDSALWHEFVSRRDRGTSEVLPGYGRGGVVRFAGGPADLPAGSPAPPPHVVYLQHASDPVVWWSPRLVLHRPDWLTERRGRDVLPAMRWYPFVTFWQLSADLVVSQQAPPGHGHTYDAESVEAWAQLAPPAGWTAARTDALARLVGRRH